MENNFNLIDEFFIHTKSRTYPVFLGKGAIGKLASFINDQLPKTTKIVVITDENVVSHYSVLQQELQNFEVLLKVVPAGEKAKSFEIYYECQTFALENKLDRNSIIIAFGGGAVGDLAGFVASTFMRGIPFIQVPTTILAHDSAIGGKVAINHELGKNLIGSFYQPHAVVYDLNFLATLSKKEKLSGFAEIIKEALIADESFFNWLLQNITNIEEISTEQLQNILKQGMLIKQSIVAQDETEQNIRAYLNLGHTLGHAIEANLGYGKWTHGQAVIVGTIFAIELSQKLYKLPFDLDVLKDWLIHLGYEIQLPKELVKEELIEKMFIDKKASGNTLNYVLLECIGKPILHKTTKEEITKLWS